MNTASRAACLVLALGGLTACGSSEEPAHHDREHARRESEHEVTPEIASSRGHAPTPPPSQADLAPPEAFERPAPLTTSQVALATTRCSAGSGRDCWLLGAMSERGEGRPTDATEARRLYEEACALPRGYGCEDLARLDPDNADAHLAIGCDGGRAPACAALGASDPANGAARTERACTLGAIDVCIAVTRVLHDATPAPDGAPTEVSLLPASVTNTTVRGAAQRCDGGMASMCAWLAVQYMEEGPFGVPVDQDHALALSRRACNDEALGGCLLVGEVLVMQQSDVAAAGLALNRSCAAGNGEACDAIALVLAGLPEARDDVRLSRFEACVLGIDEDCSSAS